LDIFLNFGAKCDPRPGETQQPHEAEQDMGLNEPTSVTVATAISTAPTTASIIISSRCFLLSQPNLPEEQPASR